MKIDQVQEGDVFLRNGSSAKIKIVSRDCAGATVVTVDENGAESKRRRIRWGTLREGYKKR